MSKSFGGFMALSGISLEIASGERVGLIGPNGSGKTTLMSCIAGSLRINTGSITFEGRDISGLPAYARTRLGIARSFQLPQPFRSMSVLENLIVPLEYVAHRGSLHTADTRAEAMQILEHIGLTEKADTVSTHLTQVDLRKLELARAMAARPRMLIADEAMAGLSSVEIEEVLGILWKLNETGITVVMIEHIMKAVMRFSQRVLCLDAGKLIFEGTPEAVVANPEVQKAYIGARTHHSRPDGPQRRGPGPARRLAGTQAGRDGRSAGHKRQRQEHAHEMRHGDGAADARRDHPQH